MAPDRRTTSRDLPDALRSVLDFERAWAVAPFPGMTKERAVRERLGLTPTRYRLLVQRAIEDPRALAHDPLLVRRLLRVRDHRRSRLRGA